MGKQLRHYTEAVAFVVHGGLQRSGFRTGVDLSGWDALFTSQGDETYPGSLLVWMKVSVHPPGFEFLMDIRDIGGIVFATQDRNRISMGGMYMQFFLTQLTALNHFPERPDLPGTFSNIPRRASDLERTIVHYAIDSAQSQEAVLYSLGRLWHSVRRLDFIDNFGNDEAAGASTDELVDSVVCNTGGLVAYLAGLIEADDDIWLS